MSRPYYSVDLRQKPGRLDCFSPFVAFSISSFFEFVCPYIYGITGGAIDSARAKTIGLTLAHLNDGLFAFFIFYLAWTATFFLTPIGRSIQRRAVEIRSKCSERFMFTLYAIGATAFLGAVMFHPARGGSRAELTDGVFGYVFFILVCCFLALHSCVGIDRMLAFRESKKMRHLYFVAFHALVTFLLLALMQGRGRAFFAIFIYLALWHYLIARIPVWLYVSIVLIAFLGAIGVSIWEISEYGRSPSFFDVAFGLDYRRNFDGLYNTSIAIWHQKSGNESLNFGVSILADILEDLKLSIPGAVGTRDYFMIDILGITDYKAGVALSKVGEFYLAGGWIGVMLGGALLGFLSKAIYGICIKRGFLGPVSIPLFMFLIANSGVATPRGYFGGKLVLCGVQVLIFLFFAYCLFQMRVRLRAESSTGESDNSIITASLR